MVKLFLKVRVPTTQAPAGEIVEPLLAVVTAPVTVPMPDSVWAVPSV